MREFRPGVRLYPTDPASCAPAEARYLGWSGSTPRSAFSGQEQSLAAKDILGSKNGGGTFRRRSVILARLAPVDYHHVHYPDDGRTLEHLRLGRSLWTVTWPAVQAKEDIYVRNEAQVNILDTAHFGVLGSWSSEL